MSSKIEGIVLSRLDYGESSIIVDIYSLQKGRITFSATSSKKKNNRIYFSPLNLIEVELYTSKKSKYFRAKELRSCLPDQLVNRDSEIHAIRYFLADFLKKTLIGEEQDPLMFQFLSTRIEELYSCSSKSDYIIDFLFDLSPYLGIDIMEMRNQAQSFTEYGFSMNRSDWDTLLADKPKSKKELLNALLSFYSHQFDHVDQLKSKEILAEVFSN